MLLLQDAGCGNSHYYQRRGCFFFTPLLVAFSCVCDSEQGAACGSAASCKLRAQSMARACFEVKEKGLHVDSTLEIHIKLCACICFVLGPLQHKSVYYSQTWPPRVFPLARLHSYLLSCLFLISVHAVKLPRRLSREHKHATNHACVEGPAVLWVLCRWFGVGVSASICICYAERVPVAWVSIKSVLIMFGSPSTAACSSCMSVLRVVCLLRLLDVCTYGS